MAGAQVDGRDRGDILRNKLAPPARLLCPEARAHRAGGSSFTQDPASSRWLQLLSSPSDSQEKHLARDLGCLLASGTQTRWEATLRLSRAVAG